MPLIQPIDEKIVLFFQSIRLEALTAFFNIFIKFEFWDAVAAVLIVFSFLYTKKFKVPVISYFLAWNGAISAYIWLKNYIHRPRPFVTVKGLVTAIPPPHSFSFPSGHATLAAALMVILVHHFPKAWYLLLALAILVGVSRVYFGVHYLSDVLAGYILGAIIGMLALVGEHFILKVNKSG